MVYIILKKIVYKLFPTANVVVSSDKLNPRVQFWSFVEPQRDPIGYEKLHYLDRIDFKASQPIGFWFHLTNSL